MFRTTLALGAFAALAALGGQAAAQTAPNYVHVGPALVQLDEGARFTAGGGPVPGGDISVGDELTGAVEVGHFVLPNIAVSLTVGLPLNSKIHGRGTLEPLQRLGTLTYGPAALTAHYHFNEGRRIRPYVGAGVAYLYVFDTESASVQNLDVDNAFGFAWQAGVDVDLTDRMGVFFDYKKAFIDTDATGNLGQVPIQGDVQVDPTALHAGLSWRF